MQHPMMGAPETEFCKDLVRIADEIAIGEEQELDEIERRLLPVAGLDGATRWSRFMSAMLTYFAPFVTAPAPLENGHAVRPTVAGRHRVRHGARVGP